MILVWRGMNWCGVWDTETETGKKKSLKTKQKMKEPTTQTFPSSKVCVDTTEKD